MAEPTQRRLTFPKSARVVSSLEFTSVLRHGAVAADDSCVVFADAAAAPDAAPRLGITIPKKVGNAVQRNRWKRHFRESFRQHRGDLPTGMVFVVRPKKGARLAAGKLQRGFPKLLNRAARKWQRTHENEGPESQNL